MPVCGQRSSAMIRASCARSSARSMSPTMRTRPPVSLAHSIRQTASMALRVASLVTARSGFLPPLELGAQLLLLGAQLGREFLAEVLGLEHRADLDLGLLAGHRIRAAPDPLERLLHRLDLPDPEAGDQLLGLGEGPVDDGLLAAAEAHALALAARVQAVAGQHHASLDQLLVELAHLGDQLLARHHAGLGVLG